MTEEIGDFDLLRPEDIPPRRRSPNDPDEEDLLTKELFASLDRPTPSLAGDREDMLTKVIFADVQPITERVRPQTVDLTPKQPTDARIIRQRVLDELEGVGVGDMAIIEKYIHRGQPRLASKPKPKLPQRPQRPPTVLTKAQKPTPEPKRPQVIYADLPRQRKRFPIKKTLIATLIIGALGLVSAVAQPSRLVAPLKLSLSGLESVSGDNFLSSVSFTLPNDKKLSVTQELLSTVLNRGGQYLVITTSPTQNTPIGGEPKAWVLLEVQGDTVGITQTGSVAELNAALPAKTIPPKPVQTYKTNFDFSETGWFLDIQDFARSFDSLFGKTTGKNIEGVLVLTSGTAARLGDEIGLLANENDPEWLKEVVTLLILKPPGNIGAVEAIFEKALASRGAQFSFIDGSAVRPAAPPPTKDTFRIGLRSWEGSGVQVELVDYAQEVFVDGSLISTLDVNLKNSGQEPSTAYVKVAIPEGSILLSQNGYSDPPPVPIFDYKAGGFEENSYTVQPLTTSRDFFPNLDFFNEKNFAVIGGWATVSPASTHTVTLRFRLPFRLAWQGAGDTYSLLVWKPPGQESVSFRYRAQFGEDVEFDWLEPKGFLTEGLAEYQTIIESDQVLQARIRFTQNQ